MPATALSVRAENVATPEGAVTLLPLSEVPPLVKLAVTVEDAVVTTLPAASSTSTTGWVARAVPLVAEAPGWVKIASWVGGPSSAMVPVSTRLRGTR